MIVIYLFRESKNASREKALQKVVHDMKRFVQKVYHHSATTRSKIKKKEEPTLTLWTIP